MRTRKLGWTDLELSVVGLGTWAMGGNDWAFGWGPQDEEQSIGAIHRALDCGINWIDTAAVYGLGHSEEVVGRALDGMSEKPLVATKCGRVAAPDGSIQGRLTRAGIRAEAEASLRRLGVEVIDLYQIHWPDPKGEIEKGWAAIAELVEEGKVRYAGVSNFTPPQLRHIAPIHPIASLQPPYSMLRRTAEKELLGYCAENRIGVVAYSPMQKGILTDKFTREWVEALPEGDHRLQDRMFQDPQLGAHLELVDGLRAIAGKHGRTVGELAVAWVLRRPEVTSAIVGARRPEQAEANAKAGDWELSAEDVAAVEELLAAMWR